MSERKYRQRGYQDESRPQRPAQTQQPAERAPGPPRDRVGPRTYNMPGLPRGGALRPVRSHHHGRNYGRELLPQVRHRPARVRAVRALRHGQALSVRADDCRSRIAEGCRGMPARSSSRSAGSSARPGPPRRDPRAPARRSTTCSNRRCVPRELRGARQPAVVPRTIPANVPAPRPGDGQPGDAGGNIRRRPRNSRRFEMKTACVLVAALAIAIPAAAQTGAAQSPAAQTLRQPPDACESADLRARSGPTT